MDPLTTRPILMGWEFTMVPYPSGQFWFINDPDGRFGNGSVWTRTRTRSDGPELLLSLPRPQPHRAYLGRAQAPTSLEIPRHWNTNGRLDTVKVWIAEVLPQIWEEIPEAYFDILLISMPNRVAAETNAKGWYPRYWACNSIRFFSPYTDIIISI